MPSASNFNQKPQHDSSKFSHSESSSYCIGAETEINLTKFPEEEILYTEFYNTWCVTPFCGNSVRCELCEHYKQTPFHR